MYLYLLPLASPSSSGSAESIGATSITIEHETVIPTPTHDGGIEHTAARFLPAATWLDMARSGEIILFPPQFFLLYQSSQFLKPATASSLSAAQLQEQRNQLLEFIKTDEPPWSDKVISPETLMKRESDGRLALGLGKPGKELEGTGRKGAKDWVVLLEFKKEGPRRLEVTTRQELFESEKNFKRLQEKL